ncbi:hypothetical protein, unlikely [Trypanosoma brucei gambiense DAL972]|uniref:Uncharacterized protein n=1 Tax=Trypanosoma brucei gambiense (strain MHOM/CI/86/DAL972) TaxID=679716 RepID=C9ZL17_TRYB9|nr:hypothetical protein, unlikely [Trypanosoma brucei gambiense DAL972]CBH10026.1 hypothetical protein, unlikely [Trypanosoma brucei gambiense DAL972]|eukprot:XP_011772316.1 hypothetical protein, unlikely [Trypanosoma brucei gambiense DAL972]
MLVRSIASRGEGAKRATPEVDTTSCREPPTDPGAVARTNTEMRGYINAKRQPPPPPPPHLLPREISPINAGPALDALWRRQADHLAGLPRLLRAAAAPARTNGPFDLATKFQCVHWPAHPCGGRHVWPDH